MTTNARELAELATAYAGGNGLSFRNRIINGDMRIDQRNAGASVTVGSQFFTTYSVDRWAASALVDSKYTVQQNAGSVTPPTGFSNYLGAVSSSAYSVTVSDYFGLGQRVEGFNFSDMAWGTASAQAVTLSFWVRSSLTGTFGGAVQNSAQTRSYPFSYTVSAANTWEYKTITIPGDTTGTWVGATNGVGLTLFFSIGTGSTFSGTAGAWSGSNFVSATGAVSVVGTNGATFYITGVQLEAGSVATPFERRPYGTELALCMRYFETSGSGGSQTLAIAASSRIPAYFAVAKRAAPTLVYSFVAGSNTVSLDVPTTGGFRINNSASGSAAAPCDFTWTASAEL